MTLAVIAYKIKRRLWSSIVRKVRSKKYYPKLYKAYWHAYFHKANQNDKLNYFSAIPNPGAGIGHQMANWIAGYWFAKLFELHFAHIPFSSEKWETFLGFGENEVSADELIVKKKYKRVLLPWFNEDNKLEVDLIKKIVQSYANKKSVFICEQDQFYRDQIGVIEDIKKKFHQAKARQNQQLIFNPNHFNIAIHVRRGDITIGQDTKNANLLMRWQNNDYFTTVLKHSLELINTHKSIYIYLFSQGKPDDYPEFKQFKNLYFCLDMNAQDSFLHMVYADLLITSKSSFSYKPALLSNGIKICPKDFWHSYPETKDWYLADDNGDFNLSV
jgi:hypothetical protein